jgi:serine/threonine protein kinase
MVMEYLRGPNLAKVIASQGPLPVPTACKIAIQICRALSHAHEQQMVHRDIKPANVIVQSLDPCEVKILDFGLARGASELQSSDGMTQDGRILGTPEFMSPEQCLRPSQTDIRADLYSLGCTLYFMLAGRPPFLSETSLAVVTAQLNLAPRPLSELNLAVSGRLWNVVSQLLEKDPSRRPQTPDEAIELLEGCLNQRANPLLGAGTTAATTQRPIARPVFAPQASAKINPRPLLTPGRYAKKRKRRTWLREVLQIVLPPLVVIGGGYYFHKDILNMLGLVPSFKMSKVRLLNAPDSIEIWINGSPTKYTRPTAGSDPEIFAEPGTYNLAVMRFGETILTETITVQANSELMLDIRFPDEKNE